VRFDPRAVATWLRKQYFCQRHNQLNIWRRYRKRPDRIRFFRPVSALGQSGYTIPNSLPFQAFFLPPTAQWHSTKSAAPISASCFRSTTPKTCFRGSVEIGTDKRPGGKCERRLRISTARNYGRPTQQTAKNSFFADGPITLLEPELYSWLVKRQLSHSSSDVIISCQREGTKCIR
jgi:hypothetical protein